MRIVAGDYLAMEIETGVQALEPDGFNDHQWKTVGVVRTQMFVLTDLVLNPVSGKISDPLLRHHVHVEAEKSVEPVLREIAQRAPAPVSLQVSVNGSVEAEINYSANALRTCYGQEEA